MKEIKTWRNFLKNVQTKDRLLLSNLAELIQPIFISGCQRSGTTILTKIFLESIEVFDYRRDHIFDSELEGALILCGHNKIKPSTKRLCFQTTYLNERIKEYYNHQGEFKLVFVLRNPYSVIYSMCYGWKGRTTLRNLALNELFKGVADKSLLSSSEMKRYKYFGSLGLSALTKACLSYIGKTKQVFELKDKLGRDILIIDYDKLVQEPDKILPVIFEFAGINYEEHLASLIKPDSLNKANRLSGFERKTISEKCGDTYITAKSLSI